MSGSYNFTVYMQTISPVVGIIALITMSIALWSTIDVNLYLPSSMISYMFKIPRNGGVPIAGLTGTVLGASGLFNVLANFLNVLAFILPAIAGPIIADFFVLNKGRWDVKLLHKMPKFNLAAILAYVFGIVMQFIAVPPVIPSEIWAIIMAFVEYIVLARVFKATGKPQGYAAVKHLEKEPILPQEGDSQLGDYDANFIHYDDPDKKAKGAAADGGK